METFCNMDHEFVYTVLRNVIMAASLVPGMISWVHSFLNKGKKTHKQILYLSLFNQIPVQNSQLSSLPFPAPSARGTKLTEYFSCPS